MAAADIAIRSLERKVTVRVTVTREFRARLWIATQLIRLAGWFIQAEVKVDHA